MSVRAWSGDGPTTRGERNPVARGGGVEVGVSARARELARTSQVADSSGGAREVDATAAASEREKVVDPKLQLLIAFVERLSGRKVELMDPGKAHGADRTTRRGGSDHPSRPDSVRPPRGADSVRPPRDADAAQSGPESTRSREAPRRAGWGLEIIATRTVSETETSEFAAQGLVRTADGREIRFSTELTMSHEEVQIERLELRAGDAAVPVEDPLVLNFGSQPVALTGERHTFDLDADGTADQVPVIAGGSALLAIDRNGNGVVDDGSELFGPRTGDGFVELAALDSDGNGWIDEADGAYERLGVWFAGAESIESLSERSVGAIYVGSVETPFQLREPDGAVGGQVRAAGVWLSEAGAVGTVQQVDLAKA